MDHMPTGIIGAVDFVLNDTEVRVLASLIEKESTTPEYHPLSLNALMLACNQKSNRDPVVTYDEDTVHEALESLRPKRLVRSTAGSRVVKYEHSFLEVFNLGRRELALLCTLMLRGAQTLGELRDRSERMRSFSDLEEVEACLEGLMRLEPSPLVKRLARQPGTKEPRYMQLLSGDVEPPIRQAAERALPLEEQVESLRRELHELREEFSRFRRQFEES
jgi:uncharacterized protein YceH (UPF0502 family)